MCGRGINLVVLLALWNEERTIANDFHRSVILLQNCFRSVRVRFDTRIHDKIFYFNTVWVGESGNDTGKYSRWTVNIFPIQFVVATCVGREGNSGLFLDLWFWEVNSVILTQFIFLSISSGLIYGAFVVLEGIKSNWKEPSNSPLPATSFNLVESVRPRENLSSGNWSSEEETSQFSNRRDILKENLFIGLVFKPYEFSYNEEFRWNRSQYNTRRRGRYSFNFVDISKVDFKNSLLVLHRTLPLNFCSGIGTFPVKYKDYELQ